MKYLASIAALLFMLTVCACTAKPTEEVATDTSAADSSEVTTSDTSAADSSEVTTSVSAVQASEEPNNFAGLSDFLTEEQIQLYKKAAEIYPLFIGHSDGIDTLHLALQGASLDEQQLYLENYQMRDDIPEFCQINDLTYAFCRGAYQTMDDFRELCLPVFTDAYFDALNDTGLNIPTFIQINGYLYHIVASRGGAFGYNPKKFPDTYTLDSRSDTEICFHVTGYYVDSPDEQDYSTTLSFPIKLTLTDNGWRFSQYADAGLDEPYNATSSSAKLTAVSALSAKVDALPESAEKARFKYALIGGSPVVYVFDDDMRFYLAYLNIDTHFASVYECTLMLPVGYTDGQIIAVKGGGGSGEYFISVAAKAGEKNVILDYFFFSNGDLPQPKSVEVFSCADSASEDATAEVTTDTSAADSSEVTTSVSAVQTSEEPNSVAGLSDFLTEEQIQLYILSAKVDALPESAEKARFKYALIGGSPVVYVFDDDMRFYLAYLNIDMHIASVYECTLMLPVGYTDGQIIAVKGSGCSGEYFISVAAKAGEKNVILDYFFSSNGDLPQPKSVEVFSCVE